MTTYLYCSPEWLAESANRYPDTPRFQKELENMSIKLGFRIKAESSWGIDKDILFVVYLNRGNLEKLGFLPADIVMQETDYVLSATPQEWKRLLRKDGKFVGDFMTGKIILEKGSKVGILSVAPHSGTLIDALVQVDLQFQDEMTPEQIEQFRKQLTDYRESTGV
jgi:putative sterol carrier protein